MELPRSTEPKKSESGDLEIDARIAQYEMAYRMQTSVPELVDLKDEPQHVLDMYGKDAMKKGTFAHNCLIARRLSERGVPFVQLFHRGWDPAWEFAQTNSRANAGHRPTGCGFGQGPETTRLTQGYHRHLRG